MKKVTIFCLHLGYGGVEKSVTNLANLISNDYEVELVSTYKLDDTPAFQVKENVKVTYLIDKYKPNREEWKKSIKKIKPIIFIKESYNAIAVLILKRQKTIQAMKNCKSDIMISTREKFNGWLGNYAQKKSYKIAWEHNHHHQEEDYIKKVVKSCQNIDSLILVSDSLRSFYKKRMKEKNIKCKCVFIPNMLDSVPDKISKLTEKRLVAIGRLSKEKGFVDLIELFNELHHEESDWKLDIIGDGSQKNKIVDKIYEYQLTEFVTVHGYLKKKEINKILEKSSLYIMTSYTESFGIVLIEAMSHGIPCLSYTSAEGANDLIENGKNGYLIENRDQQEMISKIKELIHDKKRRTEMGKNAREISLKYTSDQIKSDWIKLLKRKK